MQPLAVLFDVGGPLDTEVEHERLLDGAIRAALAAEGFATDDRSYATACAAAVATYAPDATAAIIWSLTDGNTGTAQRVYAAVLGGAEQRAAARGGIEARPGMAALLRWLHDRGLLLGLAANQPASAIARLDACGLGQHFQHREVSGSHGFRKPDVRLFLRACAELGVPPEGCIMIGDRIDNDMAPARMLGMRTVLFRTGRHAGQQPRSWQETPDREVHNVDELGRALGQLLA